jgi:uncharacterized protein YegP (UPF0339 family)
MRIEVWQGKAGKWFWHFRQRGGKVTADAQPFPSKGNAIRAAKGVVRATIKASGLRGYTLHFLPIEGDGITLISWWVA